MTNVPDLLARITQVHAATTGWCPLRKAHDLAMAVLVLRPKVVVELGVWGGKSLLPMALACQSIGSGKVYAVDPWSAAASIENYDKPNVDWWGKQDHEAVYSAFVNSVRELALDTVVEIARVKSKNFSPKADIDLLHVDGNHSEVALADVNRFAPVVRIGGLVCMDDVGWSTGGVPTVAKAVAKLLKLGFTELYRTKVEGEGEWAFFQRTHAAGR